MIPFVPPAARVWQLPHPGLPPGRVVISNSCLPRVALPEVAVMWATAPQPAVVSAVARARVTSAARSALAGRLGGEAGHGLLARLVDGENAVEAGDLEDLGDVPVTADQREDRKSV